MHADASCRKTTFSSYPLEGALVEACARLGFAEPTEIQARVLETIGRRKDILAISRTGTGKTLAYALPVLHNLLKDDKYFYCLVLLPTRELSQQVHSFMADLGKDIGLRISLLIGGEDMVLQGKSLANRPHLIVGTPGRVAYHLKNTKGFSLDLVRYLVLDECDRLLDGDFEGEVAEVLEKLGPHRNTLLFTATITKRVEKLKHTVMKNPLLLGAASRFALAPSLVQNYVFLPLKRKEAYLYCVVRGMGAEKVLVFVSTCLIAEKLHRLFSKLGFGASSIHGGKTQRERTKAMEEFRKGGANVLIATDVAARGIDITDIKCIVNYDVPAYVKDYVHRVGRTARAERAGRAITFVTQYDVEEFQRIEGHIGKKMEEYEVDREEVREVSEEVFEAKREAENEMKDLQISKKIADLRKGVQKKKKRPSA